MSLSLYLLAISLTAHQAQTPAPYYSNPSGAQVVEPGKSYSDGSAMSDDGKHHLFPRLHSWFFPPKPDKNQMTDPQRRTSPYQQIETPPPPRASDIPDQPAPPVQQTRLDLKPENLNRIGAAPDYTWVTGQLFRVHAGASTHWVVRYAPQEQVDRFGGIMVLSTSNDMRTFHEGDLICVHGKVMDGDHTNRFLGGALYKADSVDLLPRGEVNAPERGH